MIVSCVVSIMAIVISIISGLESVPSENTHDSCAMVEQLLEPVQLSFAALLYFRLDL